MRHANPYKRRDIHRSNCRNGVVHRVITDVAVFAVDYDPLLWLSPSTVKVELGWKCDNRLTSRPVCATICAVRKDGSPRNVIIGLAFVRRAFRSRSLGFWTVVVRADGNDIFAYSNCTRVEGVGTSNGSVQV